MPKPTKGARLGGSSSHQKAILANLATSLFEHGRIKTTDAKARALRPYAEKLITHAKKGALHNRRVRLRRRKRSARTGRSASPSSWRALASGHGAMSNE